MPSNNESSSAASSSNTNNKKHNAPAEEQQGSNKKQKKEINFSSIPRKKDKQSDTPASSPSSDTQLGSIPKKKSSTAATGENNNNNDNETSTSNTKNTSPAEENNSQSKDQLEQSNNDKNKKKGYNNNNNVESNKNNTSTNTKASSEKNNSSKTSQESASTANNTPAPSNNKKKKSERRESTTKKSERRGSVKSEKQQHQQQLRVDVNAEPISNEKGKSPGPSSSNTTAAMDNHPYARGSVIEVLHGVPNANLINDNDNSVSGKNIVDDDDNLWWSENEDSEPEDNEQSQETDKKSSVSVRLCDVIDRISVGDKKWRYYIHYRDFNRRMDEWVSMDRIVSPPSVGNAKARAIKKEEERQKRKQQRLEEKTAAELGLNLSAPRSSRRRSNVTTPQAGAVAGSSTATTLEQSTTAGTSSSVSGTSAASNSAVVSGDDDAPRRTRLQRRKTQSFDDDNTVAASNKGDKTTSSSTSGAGTSGNEPPSVVTAEKGIVAIPTTAATHTTVGAHVVATVPAQELDEHEGLDEASLREHEEVTKVKNVSFLELGAYQMETWYFSPIPKELLSEKGYIEVLCVCEFTLNMFARRSELRRFQARLPTHKRHPPGNEIYRNGNLSMFEVDGFEERIYCQNLCYIAKLFLDHKTLYFDVDPFLFYVLCERDSQGYHPVGYYSKEKYSDVGYNLACILTFPSHQRKGYGRFLIAFSYELTKKEEKVGSPEKPMSDLGQQAYKPYWASTIVDFLLHQSDDASSLSIMDISKKTSIMAEDIVFTLNQLGILKIINGVYFIAAEQNMLQKLAKKYPIKKPIVDPTKLHWSPFVTDVKRDKFSIHSKKPSVEAAASEDTQQQQNQQQRSSNKS